MAASSSWSLQQGIYQALAGDPQVTGLLGGANIYDDAPQNASFPYLTFGQTTERDWSFARAWLIDRLAGGIGAAQVVENGESGSG